MTFNHVMLVVSDMEEALKLWRDMLGFKVIVDSTVPDGFLIEKQTQDDCYGVKDVCSRLILAMSEEGAVVELQQPSNPMVRKTPKEYLDYSYTGENEIALNCVNIDEWYKKIVDAGYEPTTKYVWNFAGDVARSFIFRDSDYNLIQLIEVDNDKLAALVASMQ